MVTLFGAIKIKSVNQQEINENPPSMAGRKPFRTRKRALTKSGGAKFDKHKLQLNPKDALQRIDPRNVPLPSDEGKNMYESLSYDDDGDLIKPGPSLSTKRRKTDVSQKQSADKVALPPPIVVENTSISTVREGLKTMDALIVSKVALKLTSNGINILARDDISYAAMKKLCTDKEWPAHTFTPKQCTCL